MSFWCFNFRLILNVYAGPEAADCDLSWLGVHCSFCWHL